MGSGRAKGEGMNIPRKERQQRSEWIRKNGDSGW